jgi:hypothetical protein
VEPHEFIEANDHVVMPGTQQPVAFRIDVGESPDTYRIRLDTGYDSGTAVVSSGSIRIH